MVRNKENLPHISVLLCRRTRSARSAIRKENPAMVSETCPLCLSAVGRASSFTCPGCKSKYHKDCAADSGACIVNGCKAAAGAKSTKSGVAATPNIRNSSQSARQGGSAPKSSNRKLVLTAVLSILIGGAVGYTAGDSSGYDRGYGEGYQVGQAAGYSSGKEDGYSAGYDQGKKDTFVSAYRSGYTAGCESVFEQLNFTSVIGYRPGLYYYRYGSVYMSKYQCP